LGGGDVDLIQCDHEANGPKACNVIQHRTLCRRKVDTDDKPFALCWQHDPEAVPFHRENGTWKYGDVQADKRWELERRRREPGSPAGWYLEGPDHEELTYLASTLPAALAEASRLVRAAQRGQQEIHDARHHAHCCGQNTGCASECHFEGNP
jgi:hypothetical protein